MDQKEKERLKNYVKYLLGKGYSKQQVKDELIGKGFDRFLVRELIYPNLKILVYSGIVFIFMIILIGWFYFFMMLSGNNIDIKPISKKTTLESVGGIEVSNVEIREENDMMIIEVYLTNNLDKEYNAPIDIKATSGDFYLTWMELRAIAPGKTLMSSAPGFKTPEKTIKVFLNSEEVYKEVFVFA